MATVPWLTGFALGKRRGRKSFARIPASQGREDHDPFVPPLGYGGGYTCTTVDV